MLYMKIWKQEDGDDRLDVEPLFISADQQLIAEVGELLRARLGAVPGMREIARRQSARPLKVSGPSGDGA